MIRSFGDKKPVIAESAFVSEAAYVIGDVEIGEGSGVFPGAVIRGDLASIKIGCNTMIEDNCVIHAGVSMVIGDNIIMGHGVVVHCTRIGNNNLIGNNSTLLDDAEIGSYCIVAAGCLVSPGTIVPDCSMVVGVPGEIKDIGDRMKRRRGGSSIYAELVKKYKELDL